MSFSSQDSDLHTPVTKRTHGDFSAMINDAYNHEEHHDDEAAADGAPAAKRQRRGDADAAACATPSTQTVTAGPFANFDFDKFPPQKVDVVLKDSIHGMIRVSFDIIKLIDTPEFQRLRELMQLGSAYYVYPSACHRRFEHCLGTCHLAGVWMEKFRQKQPYLGITDREVFLVQAAALCHDLGHGPFSHVFDNEVMPRLNKQWKHEEGSSMMFRALVKRVQSEDPTFKMDQEDIDLVINMIEGKIEHAPAGRRWMFQIVSNPINSIDVDKFDYLLRDSHNVGIPTSVDVQRIMENSLVIGDHICFHAKDVYTLYKLFDARYALHKFCYTHKAGKSVEYMITDALVKAEPVLKLCEKVDDPEKYLQLDDSILRVIEFSTDPLLEESRKIIANLRARKLYRFVDERLISATAYKSIGDVKETDILAWSTELTENDIIVHNMKINYALKNQNPVEKIFFYKLSGEGKLIGPPFHVMQDSVSLMLPRQFEERYVRLYVRDESKKDAAYAAFTAWARTNGLIYQQHGVAGGADIVLGSSPYAKDKSSTPTSKINTSTPARSARASLSGAEDPNARGIVSAAEDEPLATQETAAASSLDQ